MIACRSIRCLLFITLATLFGCNYNYYYDMVSLILIAFCIAFILCDLLRIKSDVKMINLIANENNNEKPTTLTKTALKFDCDNHDKVQFESLEPAVSRITNLVKEEQNSKGTNTKVLIKKENNGDTNTTASINKDNNESANTTKILDNELPILNSIQIQE